MPSYARADESVRSLILRTIDLYHPDLAEAKARIGAVMAYPSLDADGEPTGPALTHHGEPALAVIKINNQKGRVDGLPDATITISAPEWEDLEGEPDGEARQIALLDHELYYLIVRRDKESGRVATDDQGRPLFEMRKYDWTLTGFRAVAERHGRHSCEVIQARALHDAHGNILFGFMSDPAADADARLGETIGRILGPDVTVEVSGSSREARKGKAKEGAAKAAAAR